MRLRMGQPNSRIGTERLSAYRKAPLRPWMGQPQREGNANPRTQAILHTLQEKNLRPHPIEIAALSHPHNQCAKGAQKVTTPTGRNGICHRTVSESSAFSRVAARDPNHHRWMPRRGNPPILVSVAVI
jgi:beta-lactamase superfamily II metal-dependent hydrolase